MARRTRTETFLQALRHPVRAEALAVIRLGPGSASEVAKLIDEPTRTVAYHLRKLEQEGLITIDEVRERRAGVDETSYRLAADHTVRKDEWDQLNPLDRERIGTSVALTILGDLSRALGAEITARADSSLVWDSFPVDEAGAAELQELATTTTAKMIGIRERNRDRLRPGEEAVHQRTFLIATHETPPR